jgi:hypothetical protein
MCFPQNRNSCGPATFIGENTRAVVHLHTYIGSLTLHRRNEHFTMLGFLQTQNIRMWAYNLKSLLDAAVACHIDGHHPECTRAFPGEAFSAIKLPCRTKLPPSDKLPCITSLPPGLKSLVLGRGLSLAVPGLAPFKSLDCKPGHEITETWPIGNMRQNTHRPSPPPLRRRGRPVGPSSPSGGGRKGGARKGMGGED